ncbi:MAG: hypothetical protein ABIH50_01835 [bacterium]
MGKKIILALLSLMLLANTMVILPASQEISAETLVISPYRVTTEKIKDEIELYRKWYLIFALFQGYVLINAVSKI